MATSTIAICLLIGIPLLIGMITIPVLLFIITFFALIAGFVNLLLVAGIIGGWYLFFSLLWEMFWCIVTFIPKQRELWTTPFDNEED